MGILSGITAVATLGSSLFGSGKETASGQPASRGESIASKIFTQSTQDMKDSGAFFTAGRDRQRQKTKEEDPMYRIMAKILDAENKREPGLEEYFKRIS